MTSTRGRAEPLVPLDDLYLNASAVTGMLAGSEQAVLISDTYGVTVVRDYADRPAVSIADAYKIRDARKKAGSPCCRRRPRTSRSRPTTALRTAQQ